MKMMAGAFFSASSKATESYYMSSQNLTADHFKGIDRPLQVSYQKNGQSLVLCSPILDSSHYGFQFNDAYACSIIFGIPNYDYGH